MVIILNYIHTRCRAVWTIYLFVGIGLIFYATLSVLTMESTPIEEKKPKRLRTLVYPSAAELRTSADSKDYFCYLSTKCRYGDFVAGVG